MVRKKIRKGNKIDIGILIGIFFILLTTSLYSTEKVRILYFRSDGCRISKVTDSLLNKMKVLFKDRIIIITLETKISLKEEKNQTIRKLREFYKVVGIPEIIINEKKFNKKYTEKNLIQAICDEFLIKPMVCG